MCRSCEIVFIKGIACHETGCPEAWRERFRKCKECGSLFRPESSWQTCCDESCYCANNGLPSPDDALDGYDPDDDELPTNCY